MYSNILIPVSLDEGRNTELAIKAAQALAQKGAVFTLLHVVQPHPTYMFDHVPIETLEATRAEARLRIEALAATLPGANAHVINGHPGDSILSWTRDHNIDCIVVASHQPAMSDYLLGSTAQMVVRHATCPVHVVR